MSWWDEFKDGLRSGGVDWFAGFLFGMAWGIIPLIFVFTAFSLWHRDYPIALACGALFLAVASYWWGRRQR